MSRTIERNENPLHTHDGDTEPWTADTLTAHMEHLHGIPVPEGWQPTGQAMATLDRQHSAEHPPAPAEPGVAVRVVFMDNTVYTYRHVTLATADDKGQLQLRFTERPARPGADGRQRAVALPLANIRWWGTPGDEVGW
jgi:hypothetical protein